MEYELQAFYTSVVCGAQQPLALFDGITLNSNAIGRGMRISRRKASESSGVSPNWYTLRNVNHKTHNAPSDRTERTHLNAPLLLQDTDRLFHEPDSSWPISIGISRKEYRADGAQPPRELLQG